ncbi:MAG: hypothetical protein KAG72_04215 [Abyssibacter sp.]|nr:hypothetical protein [Abyssibacter sp.]
MRASVGDNGTVHRLGGDKFVILLKSPSASSEAADDAASKAAEAILSAIVAVRIATAVLRKNPTWHPDVADGETPASSTSKNGLQWRVACVSPSA